MDCSALNQDATHGSNKKFRQHGKRLNKKDSNLNPLPRQFTQCCQFHIANNELLISPQIHVSDHRPNLVLSSHKSQAALMTKEWQRKVLFKHNVWKGIDGAGPRRGITYLDWEIAGNAMIAACRSYIEAFSREL